MNKVKVLIVDDSKVMQNILATIIQSDPFFEVVGVANDPYDARDKIKTLNPQVLTVDIEMPKMNGLTFIQKIMQNRPLPIIVTSSFTREGCDISIKALELGAVDVIGKPKNNKEYASYCKNLIELLKTAATVSFSKQNEVSSSGAKPTPKISLPSAVDLITIGSSTGGTEAIRKILSNLSSKTPPIIITQHIPANFVIPFAESLNKTCKIYSLPAQDDMELEWGKAYLAPGDVHLGITANNGLLKTKLLHQPAVDGYLPAVNAMFESVAENNVKNCIAILLTGMGADGAKGLLKLKHKGALTIAQNKESSIVWGMPRAAVDLNAALHVLGLDEITRVIKDSASINSRSAKHVEFN